MFYYPLKPTRITLSSPLFLRTNEDENFIAQKKKNGWRIQVHKKNEQIEIYTRHNKRIEPLILEVDWKAIHERLLSSIKCNSCILDGEFLQRRSTIKEHIYLWDIFSCDNQELRRPYKERKEILSEIILPKEKLEICQDYANDFLGLWNSLENEVDEGIVIKDINEMLYVSFSKTIKSLRQFKLLRDDARNIQKR